MKRIGILGGGQLARMMVIEGFKMGLEMHVLSSRADDPAAQVTRFWHEGDPNSEPELAQFLSRVDVATVESEFLDERVLAPAIQTSRVAVVPSPKLLGLLSDRKTQKEWLKQHKIPTSPFVALHTATDARNFFREHAHSPGRKNTGGVVFKKRRHGYDGYGTFIIQNGRELEEWLNKFGDSIHEFICEAFIPFRRELALQFARNTDGEILCYPLVEWHAQNSRCLWVKGPVGAIPYGKKSPSDHPQTAKLTRLISRALKQSSYVGLISFELFEARSRSSAQTEILVNEIAPRVHNSGHYSLEATTPNQFQAHLRAILNWPLPKTAQLCSNGFAMWNILGKSDSRKSGANNSREWRPPHDVHMHWYGKSEIREGRKMGHMTALAATPEAALKILSTTAKRLKL